MVNKQEESDSAKRYRTIASEWKQFSQTLAYKDLMEHIELQKQINTTMASGPMEVIRDVPISDKRDDQRLDFEPEKYAYLLQRSVGCDIVKTYVEGYVNPEA